MEDVLFNCVIGIDVHMASLVCCAVWTDADNKLHTEKVTFGTFKNQKKAMAAWCKQHRPDLVIMESTGIYWKSPYAFLEKVGIFAAVVNARQIKQMEGKKTDMGDAEWLAHVGRLGCFNRSFIPTAIYRLLRNVARYHLKLTDELSAEKNRLHKLLADPGYRLSLVFSDLHGTNASICVDGILDGKSVDAMMSEIDVKRLKASYEEIRDELDGDLPEETRYVLCQIRDHIDFLQKKIDELLAYVANKIRELNPQALELLQTIPGVSEASAVKILIELGGEDMTPFKTAEHLASWLGVCPGNNESAGKRKHGRTRKGNYYLRRVLCECANAAARTKGTTLKSKYRSLSIRRGHKRSIIAIVHKMIKIIFFVLKNKVGYRDPEIDYEKESAQKNARRWVSILCSLPEWQVSAQNLRSGETFASAEESSAATA